MADSILLTGGSGLLALNWAMAARREHRVVLGLHERRVTLPGVESRVIDLDTVANVSRSLDEVRPALLVHTAGLTSVERCEAEPSLAHHANVTLAQNVARACAQARVQMVHISTDHLFGGKEELVTESHPIAAVNVYGRTKGEAEAAVLAAHPEALIIRTNFYGWGPRYRLSFSDHIVRALRASRPTTLFSDVFYTPTLIEDVVNAVHDLVARRATGIFHVTGDDRLSKLEFGLRLAHQFGLNGRLIKGGRLCDRPELVRRPADMSLSNAKLRGVLGRGLGSVREQLAKLYDHERLGRAAELEQL